MALKRDALDAAFSDCVRWAADWRCQWPGCSMHWPACKGQDAHCSHFKSRGYSSVRWFPDNAALLCAAHHDYAGKNPDEHTHFFKSLLGETRYEWMIARYRRIFRYRPADKAAMRKHFNAELERLKAARADGVTGPLEFAAYD